MKAESLALRNYRNLENAEIEFAGGVNIFTGANAQGKTNILEAVWLFSACRSFRGAEDRDFIRHGEEYCEIEGSFTKNGRTSDAKIKLAAGKRRELYKNDIRVKPSELVGSFNTVLFYPEQLSLVKGAPEQRRRFLDFAVSQLRPRYLECSAKYAKLLAQKNYLLRSGREDLMDTLEQWNTALAENGAYISFMRNSYLNRIAACARSVSEEISGGKEKLELSFNASGPEERDFPDTLNELRQLMTERLAAAAEDERRAGHALVGCHRDDFSISLNGLPAKTFASQGQQRSCVIALKTAEAELINEITGEYPVMLFDDVFSELDGDRKRYMINRIRDKQVIVTCCEPVSGLTDGGAGIFTVSEGRVKRECM